VFLDVVDYALRDAPSTRASELEVILTEAGSAWSVTTREGGGFELTARVEEAVRATIESTVREGGRAGIYLAKAWTFGYGRHPDASAAYRDSIRAVEVAAKPVVSPKNERTTLGTMIADVRNRPGKWTTPLRAKSGGDKDIMTVLGMMELLWHGQHDRHGTNTPNAELTVSLEEARMAVHLAATLVRWFGSGAVRLE